MTAVGWIIIPGTDISHMYFVMNKKNHCIHDAMVSKKIFYCLPQIIVPGNSLNYFDLAKR